MGTSAVNSIGQDPRLNQWFTLKGKFNQAYPVEKTEAPKQTYYGIEQPIGGVTESASVNHKSPTYASGLAYDGVYNSQLGGIDGAKFDSNKWLQGLG